MLCNPQHASLQYLLCIIVTALLIQALGAASVAVPSSDCYTFDNSSRIVDFSSWIGHYFEYDGKDTDLVVQFCKDVETRSQQPGYLDFGRFDRFNYFVTGSGHVDFVQRYYNGDLVNCEHSYDKLGRTAQVNIICGSCLNGQCKDPLGCICNISYESNCRVFVELAIPCEKPGARVFKGFTVGFSPLSWEIVYNGMTQLGFEKSHPEFSFRTEQTHLTLYVTAIASLSTSMQKPIVKVFPEKGLNVRVAGSAALGKPPTTLSPTILDIEWTCQKAHDAPYEVNVTIPIQDYEPINFSLTKMCKHRNDQDEDSAKGWAIFGVISCVFLVSSIVFCCGGFIYKTRVQHLRGIDALPGMTVLSACLETVSGTEHGYSGPQGRYGGAFASEISWEQRSVSTQAQWRSNDTKYGTV